MATQSDGIIAGIASPDTPLVREVTGFIREAEDDLLFDHSRRVFLFGALQGRRLGLRPDLASIHRVNWSRCGCRYEESAF